MRYEDALALIAAELGIDGIDDFGGRSVHVMGSASDILVIDEGSAMTLAKRLGPGTPVAATLAKGLLVAHAQGAATGFARFALDEDAGLVLLEHLDVAGMDETRFRERVEAFMAHAEYADSVILPELAPVQAPRRAEDTMIRV